ncbi:MAG: class I SAM-dependent methyltransferase [Acidimicrobiales bacterium]
MTRGPRIGPGRQDGFDGQRYQERFDALQAAGVDTNGEANFVTRFAPESVLDAGCGTGRVAIELARRGLLVVGVDRDESMLEVARKRAAAAAETVPGLRLRFVHADLVGLVLEESFDVAVMAGNVPLFTGPGTEGALVASVAIHVRTGGVLISGFQLDGSYSLELYDMDCKAAGLELAARYGTWEGTQSSPEDTYAVSVHQRP